MCLANVTLSLLMGLAGVVGVKSLNPAKQDGDANVSLRSDIVQV